MIETLSNTILSRLSKILSVKTALHFPKERWIDLERKAVFAAKELGFPGLEELTVYLESTTLTVDQVEILAKHLTIGETYFWREPMVFEALEQKVLPVLLKSRKKKEKRLRIWSAGCASGEEPYSIAISLLRVIPDIENWNITILATDINKGGLKKAIKGIYGKNSFRNVPSWFRERYFIARENEKQEILPAIRNMVTFTYLNLADDIYPSLLTKTNAMDIIFCRNVLMYFGEDRAKQIIPNLYNSLVDGGWLIASSSELSQQLFSQFTPVNFPGAVLYRKTKKKSSFSFTDHSVETPKPLAPTALDKEYLNYLNPSTFKPSSPEALEKTDFQPIELSIAEALPSPADKISAIYLLANQGKLEEAEAACEKAIVSDKLNPWLYFLLATVFQEHGMISKAITSLKHVIYLNPAFIMAYYSLGNLYQQQGNVPLTRRSFENVLSLLKKYNKDDILPDFEGMTAGRLKEIINATIKTGMA